jgi:hypothetical protein
MCYEYYERLQRLEDQRRRESLEQPKRQTEKDLEQVRGELTERKAPAEPSPIREKVPA